jgi:hypothetical protein
MARVSDFHCSAQHVKLLHALSVDTGEKLMAVEGDSPADVNAFKIILYLCARHDYDLKYLLEENELEITKRRHLLLKEGE